MEYSAASDAYTGMYSRIPNKRVDKNFFSAGAGGTGVGTPNEINLYAK